MGHSGTPVAVAMWGGGARARLASLDDRARGYGPFRVVEDRNGRRDVVAWCRAHEGRGAHDAILGPIHVPGSFEELVLAHACEHVGPEPLWAGLAAATTVV